MNNYLLKCLLNCEEYFEGVRWAHFELIYDSLK